MTKPYVIEMESTGEVDVLQLVERPTRAPGPKEVLVRQSVSGLNFIDTYHRTGFYPVSASGAADEYAFRYGNSLLGNEANAAALEILFGQTTIQTNHDCLMVLTGADCAAQILENDNSHIKPWQVFVLSAGQKLKLHAPRKQNYSYLCVYGGIQTPIILNSHSDLPKALKQTQNANIFPLATPCHNHQFHSPKINSRPELFYATEHLTLRFIPHKHQCH